MNNYNLSDYLLFNTLNENEILHFLKIMKINSYKKNDTIIKENEIGDSIMLLLDGAVSITKALTMHTNKNEKREKEFIKLQSTDFPFFGEISIFKKNRKRTATIKAASNCNIGVLDKKDLITIFKKNSEIGYKVVTNISHKLIDDLLITNSQVLKLTTAFSLILDE